MAGFRTYQPDLSVDFRAEGGWMGARLGITNDLRFQRATIQKRISNATSGLLKKGREQSLDFFRMSLDFIESAEEALTELAGCFEEPVVGGFPASVMPEPFLGIKFRRVFWQRKYLQAPPLLLKPIPNLRIGVI